MSDVVLSVVPVFLVIAGGFAVRRLRLVEDAFWAPAERLTYHVFFPALLVTTTAGADIGALPVGGIAAAMAVGSTLNPLLLVALRRRLGFGGPTFTSVVQGSIRPNTYIGIAAAFALAGERGLALVAVCVVVNVALVNLISVVVLVRYAGEAAPGARRLIGPVASNPLILACLLGGALNLSGIGTPPLVGPLLGILGQASLPLALLAAGAGLDFARARGNWRPVALAAALKLVALPAVVWGVAMAVGLDAEARAVAVAFGGLPVAAASYVLARRMGGDAPTMAGIISATTPLSMVTLPLAMALGSAW